MTAGGAWLIAPFLLPLLAGTLLLFVERLAPRAQYPLGIASTAALLVIAWRLLQHADGGTVEAYLLGNWPAPFGIAFALDRLSALMVTDIIEGGTELLCTGDCNHVELAFDRRARDGIIELPGVMSRKKQVAPKLLAAF